MRKLVTAMLFVAIGLPVAAEAQGLRVTDPTTKAECGACHMPFAPTFLPKRSWEKIMNTLDNHFGEDASLADAPRKSILAYLSANASDVSKSRAARAFSRGLTPSETPLRVTETPLWKRIHDEVANHWWTDPRVKSKANCTACHRDAARGIYEDD